MTDATAKVGSRIRSRDDFEEHEDDEDFEGDEDEEDDDDDFVYEVDVEEHQLTIRGPSLPYSLTLELSIDESEEMWTDTIHVKCKHNREIVGKAHGQHIIRDSIRTYFYNNMDAVTHDMSELAIELFDRYGCLKKEFKDHPVRKGSGAWGSELDRGSLFFIESVLVDPKWRRLGLGSAMIKALMKKAESHDDRGIQFSLLFPGCLNNEVNREARLDSNEEIGAIQKRHWMASLAFWRSLGFRRVGASKYFSFATDSAHAAHKLAPADDYDPQDRSPHEVGHGSNEVGPVHNALITLPDAQCVDFFKACMTAEDVADPGWRRIDSAHDNVIHVAACLSKPQAVLWLLNIDQDKSLRLARNSEGYTPLEALQAKLEASRNYEDILATTYSISDKFRGYSPDSVSCMGSLKEMSDISEIQALRLKYGCTCEECLMGFLSPRMRCLLLAESEMIYDVLSDDIREGRWWRFDDIRKGRWWRFTEQHMHHGVLAVKKNFGTNKSLCQGFAQVFHYIASCLHQNKLPTVENVLEEVSGNIGQWPPVTQKFLLEGREVEAALRKVFDDARDRDDKAGDGCIRKKLKDDILALPECRNDHEFGFVALTCRIENTIPLMTF